MTKGNVQKKKNNCKPAKVTNSYGYDLSKFAKIDFSVRRDKDSGRLIDFNKSIPKARDNQNEL